MDDLNVQKKSFFSLPKFIFLVLGLILLAELIYAIRVLTLPTPLPAPGIPIQAKVGKIALNAARSAYRVNEVVSVAVNVDTGSQIVDGADVIIHYDPKVLEASSGGLIKGSIFEEYPGMTVDTSKGLISISGISSLQSGFKGTGQFAAINFKAKGVAGKTELTIDFKGKGTTTDSNLVGAETSKDILEQVDNLELLVQ